MIEAGIEMLLCGCPSAARNLHVLYPVCPPMSLRPSTWINGRDPWLLLFQRRHIKLGLAFVGLQRQFCDRLYHRCWPVFLKKVPPMWLKDRGADEMPGQVQLRLG
jgi:hypothetical protein